MTHSESITLTCEQCKGTGWTDSEFECDYCNGTGQIEGQIAVEDEDET